MNFIREVERRQYKFELVNALMFLCSQEPEHIIPTSNVKEATFSEFVNGTLAYLGKKSRASFPKSSAYDFAQFEEYLWEEFKPEVEKTNKIPIELKRYLLELADVSVDGGTCIDDPSINCRFYQIYSNLFGLNFTSTESMSLRRVNEAKNFLSRMEGDERKTLGAIGKEMRPFLKKDLEYISSHYHY